MAPVFLSYARNSSVAYAKALKAVLGDDAFLDSAGIEDGAVFPDALIEALLNARVVVVLLSESYFTREYCWREFRVIGRVSAGIMERLKDALAFALDLERASE